MKKLARAVVEVEYEYCCQERWTSDDAENLQVEFLTNNAAYGGPRADDGGLSGSGI